MLLQKSDIIEEKGNTPTHICWIIRSQRPVVAYFLTWKANKVLNRERDTYNYRPERPEKDMEEWYAESDDMSER